MTKPIAASASRSRPLDYDASETEWVLPSGQDLIAFALGVGLGPGESEARPTRSARRRPTGGRDDVRASKSALK